MRGTRAAVTFLLCLSVFHAPGSVSAQNVKTTSDKSVDFAKYKKYTWGPNYLLTQQTQDVQERINRAIVDSINRTLRASEFVEDDKNPDFTITYEAGGQPKVDVGAQRYLYDADMVNYYWGGDLTGMSSAVWVSSLAKMQITVTDAATKQNLWQATASMKIRDRTKFGNNIHENVDRFIQKTMKSFPPKN
jgi:hypothetical protein